MKHFTLISEGIDVSGLAAEIKDNPQLWNAHNYRKVGPGTPHREMDDIWVHGNDMAPYEAGLKPWSQIADEIEHIWYPAWDALPSLKPIIADLMKTVEGESIGIVLITRIPPGGKIYPHVDRGRHVEEHEKFYLSVKSEPGAMFWMDHRGVREELNPKPGEIWLTDNRKLHGVINASKVDRITLIVCIKTKKYGHIPLEVL